MRSQLRLFSPLALWLAEAIPTMGGVMKPRFSRPSATATLFAALAMPALFLCACCGGSGGGSSTGPPPPPVSVSLSETSATVDAGGTASFTATVSNDSTDSGVSWSVSCPTGPCGTVSPASTPSGTPTTYTAPAAPPANNVNVTLVAASVAEPAKTATATVTIPAISVSVSPATAVVQAATTVQLAATVSNALSNNEITWAVSCPTAPCGTVSAGSSSSGAAIEYMAPSPWPEAAGNITVTATSVADPSKTSSTTLIPVGDIPGYDVGVYYQSLGANINTTGFIAVYNQPQVRQMVQAQLQQMADRGATIIQTGLWVGSWASDSGVHFPLTRREQANIREYAQDVASVVSASGHRLRLVFTLGWTNAADYTIPGGIPTTTVGSDNLSLAEYISDVQATTNELLAAVGDVTRPDGVKVVETIYFVGEATLPDPGTKAGSGSGSTILATGWFLVTNFPYFVSAASQVGIRPTVYFGAQCVDSEVFDDTWVDASFPILNAHHSMWSVYRGVKFFVENDLPLPTDRLDFDCYMQTTGATYDQILQRVLDDADATLPSLGAPGVYNIPEGFYLLDPVARLQYGQAFATQAAQSPRLRRVSFWTWPGGGGPGLNPTYPFSIEDYLPPPSPSTAGSAPPQGGEPVSVAKAWTLTTIASYFLYPGGVAVDGAGNVYVADTENNAVREIVAATGAVKTLGSVFGTPRGVAVDAAGNVYVADTLNNAVREIVVANGAINTLGSGFNTPGGVAVDAAGNVYVADTGNNALKEIVAVTGAVTALGSGFNTPNGVAVDTSGNVYVADTGNNAVKEIVAATGAVISLGTSCCPGAPAGFLLPAGVAVDSAGDVYVADSGNQAVREIVAATGVVNTLPSASGPFFNQPSGVAVDAAGDVYVADTFNSVVKEIVAATGSIDTLCSGFFEPLGVAVDAAGNLYVADTLNNAVKEIVAASGVVNTLGSGFFQPFGVAVDAAGNVYVADTLNNVVKEIVAATGAIKTLNPVYSWGSVLAHPEAVAVDAAGNVYLSDTENEAVKEIVAATGAINTLSSAFNGPSGVAVDAAGNVYVADTGNDAVEEIVAATGAVNTLSSAFNAPSGVAVDAAGNVYVADTGNNAVEEIVAATGAVVTLGSGFRSPSGVAVGANGSVYVIDYENVWEFTPSGQRNSVPKRPLRKIRAVASKVRSRHQQWQLIHDHFLKQPRSGTATLSCSSACGSNFQIQVSRDGTEFNLIEVDPQNLNNLLQGVTILQ